MKNALFVIAAVAAQGCTCATEPAPSLQAPPLASAPSTPRKLDQPIAVKDLPKDFHPKAGNRPSEHDPSRAAKLRANIKAPPGLARLGRMMQPRMALVGQGKLTLTVGDRSVELEARAYRRGEQLVLSGDRPDLGALLTVPSLAVGEKVRDGEGMDKPNLRVRMGALGQGEQLQSADQVPGRTLATRVQSVTPDGVVSGDFDGQVSRDAGQSMKKVSGRFEARLDVKRPEVDSWLRLAGAVK